MCMRMRNVLTAVDPTITSVFFPLAEAYNTVKAQYKLPASVRNSLSNWITAIAPYNRGTRESA